MSIIEAEVESTRPRSVGQIGQTAKITIDALPDKSFTGKTPRRQQPIRRRRPGPETGHQLQGDRDHRRPDARGASWFHVLGRDHDATRTDSLAVPIQGDGCSRLVFDQKGEIVREKRDEKAGASREASNRRPRPPTLPPGQTRKETEGV